MNIDGDINPLKRLVTYIFCGYTEIELNMHLNIPFFLILYNLILKDVIN